MCFPVGFIEIIVQINMLKKKNVHFKTQWAYSIYFDSDVIIIIKKCCHYQITKNTNNKYNITKTFSVSVFFFFPLDLSNYN